MEVWSSIHDGAVLTFCLYDKCLFTALLRLCNNLYLKTLRFISSNMSISPEVAHIRVMECKPVLWPAIFVNPAPRISCRDGVWMIIFCLLMFPVIASDVTALHKRSQSFLPAHFKPEPTRINYYFAPETCVCGRRYEWYSSGKTSLVKETSFSRWSTI